MRRVWQIADLEDQSKEQSVLNFFKVKLIDPFYKICLRDKGTKIRLVDLLEDNILFGKDYNPDRAPMPDTAGDMLVKDKYGAERFRIITRLTTLYMGWHFVGWHEKIPADLVFLDIKMHEVKDISDSLDGLETQIMHEYLGALNKYSNAFDTKNLNTFREMGGVVLFGKIIRLQKRLANSRNYPDPFPIIIIQTASEAIDKFSALEYAFPDRVKVVSKPNIGNDFFELVLTQRIKQLVSAGSIDPLKIQRCLQLVESSFPLNCKDYKKIFNMQLNSGKESWSFASLFPWICSDLVAAEDLDQVKEITKSLWGYVADADWTRQLYSFFESCPVKQLTHPTQNFTDCHDDSWIGRLQDFVDKAEQIPQAVVSQLPPFMYEAYRNGRHDTNQDVLSSLCSLLQQLPSSRKQIEAIVSSYDPTCTSRGSLSPDDMKCSCSAWTVCALEAEKQRFRKKSAIINIKQILDATAKQYKVTIRKCNTWSVDLQECYGDEVVNDMIKEIKANEIELSFRVKLRYCYFPWSSLKSLIQQIFVKCLELGETVSAEVGLYYSDQTGTVLLILQMNSNFSDLENASFSGDGLFDDAIRSLKCWCKIHIANGTIERNVYMPKEVGTRTATSGNGTRYVIGISAARERTN